MSPTVSTKATEVNGQVTFTFAVNSPITFVRIELSYIFDPCPDYLKTEMANQHGKFNVFRRKYDPNVLTDNLVITLPIDGQLYSFYYCVGKQCTLHSTF